MGFNLRGYTFLCDQVFGSYGQNKFWTNTLSIGGYSVIDACAWVGGPPRARTPPHLTSEVMLSAFIRIYPRLSACGGSAFIPVWGLRMCSARGGLRACDVML